jgi:heme/copper-type cytochrome/quinol oxidase subunit 3
MYSTVDDRFRATYTIIIRTAIVINYVGFNRNANESSLTTEFIYAQVYWHMVKIILILSRLDSP